MSDFFQPLENRVLLKKLKAELVTSGGIVLPESYANESLPKAQVLSVGRGRITKKGKVLPTDVKVGDEVLISKFSGEEIEMLGEKVMIVREDEIIGVVVS